MSKWILIQEDDYERQYWESMNYLDGKYHNQPTKLNMSIPVEDDGDISVQAVKARVPAGRHVPIGKLVI